MSNPTAIPVEDPAVVTVENSVPRAVSVGPDRVIAVDVDLGTPQGSAFRVRRDLEVYSVSCHPQGFLQRVG